MEKRNRTAAADAAHARSGGSREDADGVGEAEPGTQPTNRVPPKYIDQEEVGPPPCRILRCAVDSLYLSYKGELSHEVDDQLEDRKKLAQASEDEQQSIAQITIADKLFSVSPHGAGRFRYVLDNGDFRIQVSRGNKLPLAYVKISSECLTYRPIPEIVDELSVVINSLGVVHDQAKVSRVDQCVDFVPQIPMDEFNVRQWVSRARRKAAYWTTGDRFSGWVIGSGGNIQSRIYDKILEIIEESPHKVYLLKIWEALGWDPREPVWRQEFQTGSTALGELGIRSVPQLRENLDGLWRYCTENWLRLSSIGTDSNKSRWPVHPLWTEIQNAVWTQAPQLALTRVRASGLPVDERLFPGCLGYISSFMARESITDWDEGLGTFLVHAGTFFEQQGVSLADRAEIKARLKGRKFSTIDNRRGLDQDTASRMAEAYRRAKDGDDA